MWKTSPELSDHPMTERAGKRGELSPGGRIGLPAKAHWDNLPNSI